ncbi:MAG: Crp/Fnr family transcriptional regulator [Pseudomonadota bacterium]
MANAPQNQLTIFTGLGDEEAARLNALAGSRMIDADAFLFHQHSDAKYAYMVESGILMMERTSASGRRQVMAFIHPGNFIGIAQNEYYEFSVRALTDARLKEIPRKQFDALQDEVPLLKDNVRRIGGNILAHTLDQVFALGQKKAHERICFLLQQLKERNPPGVVSIDLVMTRQDIADYLGLTIETVSRAFSKLKREGLIDIHSAHTVVILDDDSVSEMALSD